MSLKVDHKTYYIEYGFGEGSGHGKHLRKQLKALGLHKADDPRTADVIIAHSGGCYLLPADIKPKLVVLVGLPVNNAPAWRTFMASQKQDILTFHRGKVLRRKVFNYGRNAGHLVRYPRHIRRIVTSTNLGRSRIPDIAANQIILVANRDDPWVLPLREAKMFTHSDNAFVSLSGSHDHIWQAPEEYAAIINYYAARLFT